MCIQIFVYNNTRGNTPISQVIYYISMGLKDVGHEYSTFKILKLLHRESKGVYYYKLGI